MEDLNKAFEDLEFATNKLMERLGYNKEEKIMTNKYTGEQLQELLTAMRDHVKDDKLDHLFYIENERWEMEMYLFNNDLIEFAGWVANGDYSPHDDFVKLINNKLISIKRGKLYEILQENEDYIIEQFHELDEGEKGFIRAVLSFKIESIPYEIEIVETYKRVIQVDAINLDQALRIAEKEYKQENIVLESSDFCDYEIREW